MSSLWLQTTFFLLFWRLQSVQALVQNVTVDARGNSNHPSVGSQRLEYLPSLDDWTFSTNVQAAINSSTARTERENATIVFHINEPSTFFFWHGFLPESAARYSVCIDCTRLDETGDVITLTSDATTTDGNRSSPVILYASERLANTTHTVVIRNLRNSIEGVVGQLIFDGLLFTSDLPAPPPSTPRTQSNGLIIAVSVVSVITSVLLLALLYLYCIRRIRRRFPDVRNAEPSTTPPPSWISRFREFRQRTICPWYPRPWRRWTSMDSRPMIQVVADQPSLQQTGVVEPVTLPIHAKLAQAHRPLSLSRFRPSPPKHNPSSTSPSSTTLGSGLFRAFSKRKSKSSTRKSAHSIHSTSSIPPPLPTKQFTVIHGPVITITSPTTNTNSIYSSAPPSIRSSNAPQQQQQYQDKRNDRASRFTVGSAVAYADLIFADQPNNGGVSGFTSVEDYARDFSRGRGGGDESIEGHDHQQRALHDSVTLPSLLGHLERSAAQPAPKAPPSAFNGKSIPVQQVNTGNRAGPKATRTFSDKLRRGTLPPAPRDTVRQSTRLNTPENASVEPVQSRRESMDEPKRASVLRKAPPPLSVKSQSSSSSSSGINRPSIMPTFSSGSSTRPESASAKSALPSTTSPDRPSPEQGLENLRPTQDVEPRASGDGASTFWESNGGTFGPSTSHLDLDASAEKENTDIAYLVDESQDSAHYVPRAPSRQTIQPIPHYRQSLLNSRPSLDRTDEPSIQHERVQSPDYPLAGIVASLLEATTEPDLDFDRSNSLKSLEPRSLRTARSSAASLWVPTPSVSEFPLPPFNMFNIAMAENTTSHRPNSGHKSIGSEAETFTDLVASTPSTFRQSGSNSITGSSSSKSAGGTGSVSAHSRTMSTPPSAFPLVTAVQRTRSRRKNVGPVRPGTAPSNLQPKASSLSRRGSKKGIPKPITAKSLFARASPTALRRSNSRDDGNLSSDESVPFFLPLPPPPQSPSGSLLDLPSREDDNRAPSRMTTTSMITMTDEFTSDDVQLVVANRELLSPATLSRPVIVESIKSATSSRPPYSAVSPASNGQWEIVVPSGPPKGIATLLTGSSYRTNGPTAPVPVSARTDAFDGSLYDIPISRKPSTNAVTPNSQLALDAGNGVLPWSPSFDWPATPPLALPAYYTESTTTRRLNQSKSNTDTLQLEDESQMITTHMQLAGPSYSSTCRRPKKDYPSSIATSTGEFWATEDSASVDFANSTRESKSSMGHTAIPWKDLMYGGSADVSRSSSVATKSSLRRQNSANVTSNKRESAHSMASTFFKGDNNDASLETAPPVPALPPLANLQRTRQPLVLNTQQRRWRTAGPNQLPSSPQTPSPGTKPIGNVNSIFATSWNSGGQRSGPRNYLP